MEELINEINAAYKVISSLSVSGDAVDVIAAVKVKLRRADKLARDMTVIQKEGESDGR